MSTALQDPTEASPTGETLLSVVYTSRASVPFHEIDLALLLAASRARNEASGITGMLLHDDGQFTQALEGPEDAVRHTLARIAADPRHDDVRTVDEQRIERRRFGSWAMGYTSASGESEDGHRWFGSPEAVAPEAGTSAAELLAGFRAH